MDKNALLICKHNSFQSRTKQVTHQTHHPRTAFSSSERVANDQPDRLFSDEPAKCFRAQSMLTLMGMTSHIDRKPSAMTDVCQGIQTQPSVRVELKFNRRVLERDYCSCSSIWLAGDSRRRYIPALIARRAGGDFS